MSLFDSFAEQFNSAVANFDAKAAELTATESELWAVQPGIADSAELMDAWQVQMDRVIGAQVTVENVQGTVATVSGWWQSIRNTLGIAPSSGALGAFAALPAIPWSALAIVAGGAAAIAGVVYSAGKLIDKARLYAWEQQRAAALANGTPEPPRPDIDGGFLEGFGDGLGDTIKWAIGGAILMMLVNGGRK